jgi:hypothetical protein
MARPLTLSAAALVLLVGCSNGNDSHQIEVGSGIGGASSSSSSSSASSSSSMSGSGGGPQCRSGGLGFQGTLDGYHIVLNADFGSFVVSGNTLPQIVVFDINPGGMLVLPNFVQDPSPHPLALLRMPDDAPNAGVWYAFGVGTEAHLIANSLEISFTLASAVRLGKCPGTPFSGSLDYCFDGKGDTACGGQKESVDAIFNGKHVTWDPAAAGELAGFGDAWLAWKNMGYVVARAGGWGLLSMPLHNGPLFDGPNLAAILCVGSHNVGEPHTTFNDFSFLTSFGAAPPVDGLLTSCP